MNTTSRTTSGAEQRTAARLEMMDRLLLPSPLPDEALWDLHHKMASRDPDFYCRLAVWSRNRGEASTAAFVATLLAEPSAELQETGRALLRSLAHHSVTDVMRILQYRRTESATGAALDEAAARLRVLQAVSPALDSTSSEAPSPRAGQPFLYPDIHRSTALLVDKSVGMGAALTAGKRLAAVLHSHTAADLHVYAFDLVPYSVRSSAASPDAWDDAFRHLQPAGSMSASSVLMSMLHKEQAVEQVVIVTGTDERRPRFVDAYNTYAERLRVRPQVFVMPTGPGAEPFFDRLRQGGVPVERLDGRPVALCDDLTRLSRPSRSELLAEVLAVPLPVKRAA